MYEELTVHDLDRTTDVLYDLRSPGEYRQFHIPGAISLPILDDDERAVVGTLYAQGHTDEAKQKGLFFGVSKMDGFIRAFAHAPGRVVLYCARGGYRSKSVAALFFSLGYPVYKLKGGIKAYRKIASERLQAGLEALRLLTLYGPTGSGKSDLLRRLEHEGYPVLDLERYANHRGSVLGGVGLGEPHSQKMFEFLLLDALERHPSGTLFLTEGESRRIGNIILPDALYRAMQGGRKLYLDVSLAARAERLVREYTAGPAAEEANDALGRLSPYIGRETLGRIQNAMSNGDYLEAAMLLCQKHYDLHYAFRPDMATSVLHADAPEEILDAIRTLYDKEKSAATRP